MAVDVARSRIADPSLAPVGEQRIAWVARHSPVLNSLARARLADGMPTLGTCAGLILLAREVVDGRSDQPILGALDVTVRRNAYGRQVASFEEPLVIHRLAPRGLARKLAIPAAAVIISLVALDRLYLGVHWTSDVIGGLLLGGIALTAAIVWLDKPRPVA